MFRWEEDCSKLRSESAPLSALDRLRFIPLNRAGSVWLTLGAQYRFKTEYLDEPDYGLRSADQPYTAFGQGCCCMRIYIPRRAFAHSCNSPALRMRA